MAIAGAGSIATTSGDGNGGVPGTGSGGVGPGEHITARPLDGGPSQVYLGITRRGGQPGGGGGYAGYRSGEDFVG